MRYHWTCSFHIILKVRLYSWKYIERTKNKEINTVYTCECITHKAKIKWLCATMHRMSKKEQKSTCSCMQFLKFILFIAHSLVNKMIVFTNIYIYIYLSQSKKKAKSVFIAALKWFVNANKYKTSFIRQWNTELLFCFVCIWWLIITKWIISFMSFEWLRMSRLCVSFI